MEPTSSKKTFIIVAVAALGVLLLLVVATVVLQSKRTASSGSNTPGSSGTASSGNAAPKVLAEVKTLPQKVNAFTLDQAQLLRTAQKLYPQMAPDQLNSFVKQTVLQWLALRDFYTNQRKDTSMLSMKGNVVTDFAQVENEFHAMKRVYDPNVVKIDGYYLKARFTGLTTDNMAQLGKTPAQLKTLAHDLVARYEVGGRSPQIKEQIVDMFNQDNQVQLLNNHEPSRIFTNYRLYPPLVNDPQFNTIMLNTPIGSFSNIIALKQPNIHTHQQEEYAYIVFYISQRLGLYLPVEALTDAYIAKANIQ